MTTAGEKEILNALNSLSKEVLESPTPSAEDCKILLDELAKKTTHVDTSVLEKTKFDTFLQKCVRSCKRHKRTSSSDDVTAEWDSAIAQIDGILKEYKDSIDKECKKNKSKKASPVYTQEPGLAKTVTEYRTRLVVQKKDMYKDPPVLPPPKVIVEPKYCPEPKRQKETGLLTFTATDPDVKAMLKDFKPNRTPEEVLRAGSFGGTYFRPITSAVTNVSYTAKEVLKDTLPDVWIKGLPMNLLTSKTYRPQVNKYGVKCGGSLGMWESSGWIVDADPYGWFQWYCRFYQGRRSSDDARQISRWLKSAGPKGRFRSQLCNKILAANTRYDDNSISPVIRQTLLHWGLEITPSVLMAHRKRVGR